MTRRRLLIILAAQACLALPVRAFQDTAQLENFIRREMAGKGLPAISVALVDDQKIIWSKGFGFADPDRKIPATADTVYRAGSVSKLFTDIGIMQLVERGALNLDAPITSYLPDFDNPITLRELMSHRSGLVREPKVGHYFDPSEPSLEATVRSLIGIPLVYEPGSHTKYSNAAIALAGYVLERQAREPFAKYLKRAVLQPMALTRSSFEPEPNLMRDLAKAYMWTYDGRIFQAPEFQLGMAPAGSLYTTVNDLARFLSALFAGGGKVLKTATLEQMWVPQFAKQGAGEGFGLGFVVSQFEGHRRIGHGGAIYGFATDLSALPDEKFGVAAITTMDSANAVVAHIGREALKLMLAARAGKRQPRIPIAEPVAPSLARNLDGRYGEGDEAIDLIEHNGALFLLPVRGGTRVALRQMADSLITDDRLGYGRHLRPQTLKRVKPAKPAPAPARWKGLIGEYGWDHDVLYVLEKDSRLTTLIEWFDYYPVEEIGQNIFRFPKWGLYDNETLTFKVDANGRAIQAQVGPVVFKRRAVGPEDGAIFRIEPRRPVAELRREAMAAHPPQENGNFRAPDLLDVATLDPTIKLDIRYATTRNFLSAIFYPQAKAFLQRPAAEALLRAHRKLKAAGYGLLIHDAYRPWYITKMFWDATPDDKKIFVADPRQGSRHNRGCAVDLSLYDLLTGRPAEMVSGYDEMSPRAFPDYPGGAALERWNRELLRRAMEEQGFSVYETEWWHFDFQDWKKYPILNVNFDRIPK